MATWSVPRAARPPASPVLLRSCVLRPTGAAQEDFEIDLGPEAEFNPVLREYLRSEQGIEIDADALADLASAGNGFDPYPVYAALGHACERVPEFEITPRLVLGTFSYAKLPMVADLALQASTLADHDVVAALAGDESALAAVRLRVPDSEPDPDPEHEHLVLDADSSQHAAIDAVRAGAHLVIKGPPGTGKSQTIVNLIAALAAEGKSTLFVAEKRAAIDAVLSRLDRLGLGDLVLDAYDGLTNKRATAQQFARSLDAAVENDSPGTDRTTSTLRDRRARLQKHVDALHAVRAPWGVSAHDAQEALVELGTRTPPPTCHVRLGSRDLAGMSRAPRRRARSTPARRGRARRVDPGRRRPVVRCPHPQRRRRVPRSRHHDQAQHERPRRRRPPAQPHTLGIPCAGSELARGLEVGVRDDVERPRDARGVPARGLRHPPQGAHRRDRHAGLA